MKDKKTFGSYIKQKRIEKNLSQQEFADILYVTKSAVSKWERGVTYPDITLIKSICRTLDITEHELIESSNDVEYQKIKKDAKQYNKIKKMLFWSVNICYMIALLVCFIVNLSVSHTLSWFFVVLAAIVCAYTFVPTLTWLTSKYKKSVFIASTLLGLFLLYLTCSVYSHNYWFMIATTGTILGYFVIAYPILFVEQKHYLKEEKYKKLSKYFALTYLTAIMTLILLLLVSINAYFSYNLSLGVIITIGIFTIPLVLSFIAAIDTQKKVLKIASFSVLGALIILSAISTITSLSLNLNETLQTKVITSLYNEIIINSTSYDINIYQTNSYENKVVYSANEKVYIEYEVNNNVLEINEVDYRKFYEKSFRVKDLKLDLYLSNTDIEALTIVGSTNDVSINKGFTFENVDISISTGDIEIENTNITNKAKVEVSTGDVELLDSNINSLYINYSTGNIELENVIVINDFVAKGSTGNILFDDFDANSIDIVVSTGNIKGTLLSGKEFDIITNTGKVDVPNTKSGGTCKIKTSTGDVILSYKQLIKEELFSSFFLCSIILRGGDNMKVIYKEPKNKNSYYKWFDDTGHYDMWYKQTTKIFHVEEGKLPAPLEAFLKKWTDKILEYKKDYRELYPVKLACIEFIYEGVVYAIYPTTVKATYNTSFMSDEEYEASWDSLFETYQREIRDDMKKELNVIHSKYHGFLD